MLMHMNRKTEHCSDTFLPNIDPVTKETVKCIICYVLCQLTGKSFIRIMLFT